MIRAPLYDLMSPDYFLRGPSPNAAILGVKVPTQEFVGAGEADRMFIQSRTQSMQLIRIDALLKSKQESTL